MCRRGQVWACAACCLFDCACASLWSLILAPGGFLVGLLAALVLGLAKWPFGAFARVAEACECYVGVIKRGVERYDAEEGRAHLKPRRVVVPHGEWCGQCVERCGCHENEEPRRAHHGSHLRRDRMHS